MRFWPCFLAEKVSANLSKAVLAGQWLLPGICSWYGGFACLSGASADLDDMRLTAAWFFKRLRKSPRWVRMRPRQGISRPWVLKQESIRFTFLPPHLGHAGLSFEPITRVSNSLPHFSQQYS
jgi:hypothetical protein